jgi:nucleoside-diphosphate-sugar epimerase
VITGASGFVGRHLTKELRQSDVNIVLLPHEELLSMENSSNIRRKWKLFGKEKGVDVFFHLAWNVNSKSWRETPSQKALIKNTEVFLQTVRNFHYVMSTGTCQEYLPKTTRLKENSDLAFDCHYVVDKHSLHSVLSECAIAGNYKVSWVRLFNIYGLGDHPNRIVSQLLEASRQGLDFQLSNPEHCLDLLHVEDAVKAFLRIASSDSDGIFNVGSGQPVTLRAIKEYLNKSDDWDSQDMMSIEMDENFGIARIADISKISNLGWQPNHRLVSDLRYMFRGQ